MKKRKAEEKLSKLQTKFKKKLKGAQFRWINEELYTKDSDVSFKEMNRQRTYMYTYIFRQREMRKYDRTQVLKRIIKDFKHKYVSGR
jgi:hypothetical protein